MPCNFDKIGPVIADEDDQWRSMPFRHGTGASQYCGERCGRSQEVARHGLRRPCLYYCHSPCVKHSLIRSTCHVRTSVSLFVGIR